jgi:site-specific DNA-methyltransferase (adenine-specific)
MGDTYGGSGKGATGYSDKSTLQGYSGENTKGRRMAKESWNFKKAPKVNGEPKSLCLIPSRFAIEMCDRGWILRNEIIWYKPNCMPSSVKDRFTVDFEKIFFFTKNKKYYFEQQLEPYVSEENHKLRNRVKEGKYQNTKQFSDSERDFYSNGGRNKRCVWTINTKPLKEAHFATYPEDLIKPCILAGCPEKGIVLDPFMGAGTTAKVALDNNRSYIGFELNNDYIKIAEDRLKDSKDNIKQDLLFE